MRAISVDTIIKYWYYDIDIFVVIPKRNYLPTLDPKPYRETFRASAI